MPRSLVDLPKAHLHLHLEGSARPSTIAELADRAGVAVPVYQGGGLPAFVGAYQSASELIRHPDDLARICRELVEDEAAEGARYIEPMYVPDRYASVFGLDDEEVWSVVRAAFAEASARTGVEVGVVVGAIRHLPLTHADAAVAFAERHAGAGVVAFGIAGDEARVPIGPFVAACQRARTAGLLVVPHAGETTGAPTVREALELVRPDRIAHGVRAVEDAAVLRRLADAGVACDVCPTSNVILGVAPDLASHPLPGMLAAGVRVTLGADDQLFFGSSLAGEYRVAREAFGLLDSALAAIATTSARASGASRATVEQIVAGIDDWLARPDESGTSSGRPNRSRPDGAPR